VSVVAIAEAAWVLERIYGLTAEEIAAAIERMLAVDVLVVESEQEVFTAMIAVKEGHGSFADALSGALGARVGCSHTVTFGQKALRLTAFEGPCDRSGSGSSLPLPCLAAGRFGGGPLFLDLLREPRFHHVCLEPGRFYARHPPCPAPALCADRYQEHIRRSTPQSQTHSRHALSVAAEREDILRSYVDVATSRRKIDVCSTVVTGVQ
jgi:hypothetical protein